MEIIMTIDFPDEPPGATIGHGPEPVRAGAGRPRQARATPGGGRAARARHPAGYPIVVAVTAAEVLAFGALAPYRPKPAFARTVEDSVYVKRGHRGAGLGDLILAELIRRARARGHHSMLARITSANTAS